MLRHQDRRELLENHGVDMSPEDYASSLFERVTKDCKSCSGSSSSELLANKLLDTKLHFAKKLVERDEGLPQL